ncbi:hypothetical protein P167DRAFT_160295 [Morchella conica CCBAS932]|uniref:Uncharacterized protein n=1 Tax=Morchella conica CCBAS932 TaxID=1392247 RepID=A0A3N4KPY9_9PEZI|nr:hypothetical protein P167DRAFT_160295 [Morchella conica CCBAS932]
MKHAPPCTPDKQTPNHPEPTHRSTQSPAELRPHTSSLHRLMAHDPATHRLMHRDATFFFFFLAIITGAVPTPNTPPSRMFLPG